MRGLQLCFSINHQRSFRSERRVVSTSLVQNPDSQVMLSPAVMAGYPSRHMATRATGFMMEGHWISWDCTVWIYCLLLLDLLMILKQNLLKTMSTNSSSWVVLYNPKDKGNISCFLRPHFTSNSKQAGFLRLHLNSASLSCVALKKWQKEKNQWRRLCPHLEAV